MSRTEPTSQPIGVAEAEALIARHTAPLPAESVPLASAAGRILRQTVRAERDQPPFDRVMMDGIAVAAGDGGRRRFAMRGRQFAGMASAALTDPFGCLEATTGAVLPQGCDTVVPIEQLRREDGDYVLREDAGYARGQFVHPRGSDCRQGDVLLEPGISLGAPAIAVLAAHGVAQVSVAADPGIAILATGDELAEVDAPLAEGQIRRSNDLALAAALAVHGCGRARIERVGDDLDATRAMLERLLADHRVLVLSGGVSAGQRDYVPQALADLGVRRVFHRISQRPGKPMWFGVGPEGQAVFALPGNPVSVLVCARRYVLPAILGAMGRRPEPPPTVRLGAEAHGHAALTCFVPASVHHDGMGLAIATPSPVRTSGDFSHLPRSHGFVQLPHAQAVVPAGTPLPFFAW